LSYRGVEFTLTFQKSKKLSTLPIVPPWAGYRGVEFTLTFQITNKLSTSLKNCQTHYFLRSAGKNKQ